MRIISRFLLGIVTFVIPVVIAACYGLAYTFTQRGRVIDKNSKAGVAGLRVDCRSASNATTDSTLSASDGAFDLHALSPASCATIAVQDEREVGPHYPATTVASNSAQNLVIEVALVP